MRGGGKLFVKTPYHPYPGELHPSNAILDDYAAPTFSDDQLVTLVYASKPDSKRIVGNQMPFGDLEAGDRFKVGDTVFTKRSDWQPSGNAIDEVEVFPEFSSKDLVEFAQDTDSPWPDFVFEAE